MLKRGEIERRIESCHVNQQDKSTLQSISTDIHYLYHFAKLNYCGFLMLFTQFHRLFGPPIHGKLLKRISNNQSSDGPLLQLAVQMNSLYLVFHESDTTIKTTSLFHPMCSHVSSTQQEAININNQVGNCNKDNESASIQPLPPTIAIEFCETALPYDTQCYRTVKKYWIHPDNVVELLLCLSNKMIVKERQANPSSYCFKAVDEVGDPHPLKASQQQSFNKVTTLYLDAPQFDGYTDLVCNKDAASITRIRWYDEGNNAKSFTQLEKKTYDRERGFTQQQQWVQQRVWLKSKRLQPWLAGDYSIVQHFSKDSCQYRTNGAFTWQESDKQRMLETCLQIENQVHSKHKVPGIFFLNFFFFFLTVFNYTCMYCISFTGDKESHCLRVCG